jgi:Rod binding domain-containing protein
LENFHTYHSELKSSCSAQHNSGAADALVSQLDEATSGIESTNALFEEFKSVNTERNSIFENFRDVANENLDDFKQGLL